MKKNGIILFFLIVLLTLVNAQPPFIPSSSEGLSIEPVNVQFIKEKQTYTFAVHVFNQSNGVPINSGLSCYLHIYNSTGNHLVIMENSTPVHIYDYEFKVNGANFTRGTYQAKFNCNSTVRGGAIELEFEVNPMGKETGTPEAILYVILTIAILILFSIVLYINIIIPGGNVKNEVGEIIFISKWKYLKIGMVLITYGLFVWLLNLLVGISDNFISLSLYYGFFSFIFTAFIKLSPIIFIVIFVVFMANWIRDTILKKDLLKFGKIKK